MLREQQALSDIFYQNTCSIWDAQRRAEILRALAAKAENGESEDAVRLFEENRNIRSYYAVSHRNKTVYPDAFSEDEVQELIPYIKMCHIGLRLAICFSLYMGISGDEIAALRYSDIDAQVCAVTAFHGVKFLTNI